MIKSKFKKKEDKKIYKIARCEYATEHPTEFGSCNIAFPLYGVVSNQTYPCCGCLSADIYGVQLTISYVVALHNITETGNCKNGTQQKPLVYRQRYFQREMALNARVFSTDFMKCIVYSNKRTKQNSLRNEMAEKWRDFYF